MLVAGLSGGIGCGKSEVRRILADADFAVIDADTIARKLSESNKGIIAAIKENFGQEIYDEQGHLRRKDLAKIVFNDPKSLEKLNSIIHTRVMNTVERQLEINQDAGEELTVVEAALHYEMKWDHAMDVMVVVTAPLQKRIKWVVQRDGITEEDVMQRIKAQIPIDEKVRRADFVIENDTDLGQLKESVDKFIGWYKTKKNNSSMVA